MSKRAEIYLSLDNSNLEEAINISKNLINAIDGIKIGKEFFSSNGPNGVKKIRDLGIPVFIDLKFHDIPNTVYGAIKSISKLQPKIINVHTLGGPRMLEKALKSVSDNFLEKKPLIIGVTLLTSLDQKSIDLMGFRGSINEIVVNLALLAKNSGLDGVVCSPKEIKLIRECCGNDFIIITPGIRLEQSIKDDQVRTLSPFEAQSEGANILVIGRPITKSNDPLKTAKEIRRSLG
ncbi:MAG: Orotidine 5'-phosphate decarboxylase [Alphaproteobacteria bacterium MarineAlpha2_Bin1]|nr:MAG: Orotidine 5'-phosphate decarboxylase [Alphaproteobacteria bacterium MarineAlpha2_Bin1]